MRFKEASLIISKAQVTEDKYRVLRVQGELLSSAIVSLYL